MENMKVLLGPGKSSLHGGSGAKQKSTTECPAPCCDY